MDKPNSQPKSHTQTVEGDAHLSVRIDPNLLHRPRPWTEIRDELGALSAVDAASLLGFLVGYKSRDQQFLSLLEEWLKSGRAMNARIAARLKGGDVQ